MIYLWEVQLKLDLYSKFSTKKHAWTYKDFSSYWIGSQSIYFYRLYSSAIWRKYPNNGLKAHHRKQRDSNIEIKAKSRPKFFCLNEMNSDVAFLSEAHDGTGTLIPDHQKAISSRKCVFAKWKRIWWCICYCIERLSVILTIENSLNAAAKSNYRSTILLTSCISATNTTLENLWKAAQQFWSNNLIWQCSHRFIARYSVWSVEIDIKSCGKQLLVSTDAVFASAGFWNVAKRHIRPFTWAHSWEWIYNPVRKLMCLKRAYNGFKPTTACTLQIHRLPNTETTLSFCLQIFSWNIVHRISLNR